MQIDQARLWCTAFMAKYPHANIAKFARYPTLYVAIDPIWSWQTHFFSDDFEMFAAIGGGSSGLQSRPFLVPTFKKMDVVRD